MAGVTIKNFYILKGENIMKKSLLPVFLILLVFLFVPLGSSASTFSNIVAYGDSLTDNGTSTTDFFGIKYFTNDKVWVEYLANSMGSTLYDVAFGGATTGMDNPAAGSLGLGLQWQLDNTLPSFSSLNMNDTLFTVWAGANDFLQSRAFNNAANNIGISLNKLYAAGARDILVGNLPDIGLTPTMYGTGLQAIASGWTIGFNIALDSVLLAFEAIHPDVNIFLLDAYNIFSNYTVGTSEWSKLFWGDGFHPSSEGHQLIADTAASVLSPVPEPATMVLLCLGLLGFAGVSRREKQ